MTTRSRARAAETTADRATDALRRLLLFPAVRAIVESNPGIRSDVQAVLPETRPINRPGGTR